MRRTSKDGVRLKPDPTRHKPTRILAPYLKKEWKAFGIATLATLLITAAELAGPVPLALVVDHLFEKADAAGGFELTSDDAWLLAGVGALVVSISLVAALASYLSDISLARAGERIVHELRVATHVHLQRLSLRFHSRRQTGDLVTRVTGDVNAVGSLFSESLASVASAVLLLVGMMVVSVLIDPVLALVAFAITPVLALTTFHARKRLKLASRQARTREGEIASLTAESFAAIREVKAFGSEPYEHKRLRRKSEERLRAGYDVTRIESRFARLLELISAFGVAAVLVVGVLRVARGAVSPGELVLMVSYTKKTQRPLRDIARQTGRIARSMARAERITEILSADDILEERPDAYDGPPARGELELDSVSFSYEPDRRALENLSLHVEAGTKLALIGRSGAGKSTVAALVARFYDPGSGRVLLDGRDLRDCSLGWLRRQVGLVLQDTVLFSGTVAENIAYGVEAGPADIEAAAKAAGAHGFISQLPEGYETALGPRGIGLSGGQRQRIAIARTLLRDPAILILDEPTTGLDAESEAQVLDGLTSLMRGRTTIIISHAPRLLQYADRAVAIEEGRLVREEQREPEPASLAKSLLRSVTGKLVTPAERSRRAPVPADAALPQLPVVLDPDAMAPFLHRSLDPGAPVPDVRVHYLRYKPATNIVVRYDVGLDGRWYDACAMITARRYLARRAAKPHNVALARLVDGRSPAPMPLHYLPEIDALIHWYPLDLELPALAEPPERLLEELAEAGVRVEDADGEVSTLAYKPRRRAVLRIGEHVLKIYAKVEEYEDAAVGLRVSSALRNIRTARLEGRLPGRLVTLQTAIDGSRPSRPGDVAFEAGELLRELHSSPVPAGDPVRRASEPVAAETSARHVAALLPVLPGRVEAEALVRDLRTDGAGLSSAQPRHQLAAAAASAELVAAIRPDLRRRLRRLLRELDESAPSVDSLVPTHGDFNARQLLVTADGLAIVDFDAMCLAPAPLDLATYSAYVVLGGEGDLDDAGEVLDELLEGYGDHPLGVSWYLATCILRRSPRPFRYLDEHWPERVEGMVRAAETVAGR